MQQPVIYQQTIEQPLKFLFQRTVEINLNRRTTKTGKLVLYKIINHNIEILLEPIGHRWEIDSLIIPYPFDFVHDTLAKTLTLSYHVRSLFHKDKLFDLATAVIGNQRCNKILNNTIRIKYE